MLDLDRISDQVPPGMGKVVHLLHQLDDQDEPIVISINGKVDLAVSDEGSFRMLVDLVDRIELMEVLKQARKDLDEGKGLSMEEVKEQARVKYGISF
jgi:sulfur carrier protein ThiS